VKQGSFFGIDFGTTNTTVVHILRDEYGSKPQLLGEGGEYPFSSIVAIPHGGGPLKFGGEVRRKRQEYALDHAVYLSMKSYLGTDKRFQAGGKSYSATDITAAFFLYIKEYVKSHHQLDMQEAVFSFPIGLSPEARRALSNAANKAGIHVVALISEPTAAFLASWEEGRAYSNAMVIDWGGGTLDISLLDLQKNRVLETAVWGARVGGDDIDYELARRIHGKIASASLPPAGTAFDEMTPAQQDQLLQYCEKAKIEFSSEDDDYPLTVKDYGSFGTKTVQVGYAYFCEVVRPIVMKKALHAINTALERAEFTKETVDAVFVVGGSCGLRPFVAAVKNLFGEDRIILPEDSQWASAKGAAIAATMDGGFLLSDDLGVLLSDNSVYPIFHKGKDKPGSQAEPITFCLTEDTQDAHFIFTNGSGSVVYEKTHLHTKGFLKEDLILKARIDENQIAVVELTAPAMGDAGTKTVEITKLIFYYDLGEEAV